MTDTSEWDSRVVVGGTGKSRGVLFNGQVDSILLDRQREVCHRHGPCHVPSPPDLKVGIARNVVFGARPVNGLRHRPEAGTTGWYLWAGEGDPGSEPDFFEPLHVLHLANRCPDVLSYLGLPPGWRFIVAPGYEDVWEDASLLGVHRS